jgi:contractile injection system tube protein
MTPNELPTQKLSIYSVEGPRIVVTAMYNPKEIQIDKSVPWRKSPQSKGDPPSLEFWSSDGSAMSFELMFDGYETGTNVHTAFVDSLLKLAQVQSPTGPEDTKRPPKVGVKWGSGRLPEFQGVVESVSTKYTMFLPDGTPVRATCRVTIREASHLSVSRP